MKKRFDLMNYIPLISNSTKIKISISLLMFAFINYTCLNEAIDSKICLLAMFFSFLGDLSLNYTSLEKRSTLFMCIGAVFFMLSHLVYASAYYLLISKSKEHFFNLGMILSCVFMVLFLFVSILCIKKSKQKLEFSIILIFLIYILIIGINFITICSYSWSFKALSFIGALSFLISDFIIGIETVFKIENDTLRKLVWIFYPIGQILIIGCR